MELTTTDVKKQLYKSKAEAELSHYVSGNLYYNVEMEDGTYQFPISTVKHEGNVETDQITEFYTLSEDLGTTPFHSRMKGSDLNRWIQMAIENGEFTKIG